MNAQLLKQNAEGAGVPRPNLTGIPTQMKLDFERRSGLSFDDVRVHYNSDKPARLGALAYTQGTQIHVGPGQERSLPHELGHVIQQKAGRVRPTRWIGGLPVNDQPELEREADLAPVQCMPAPALWGVIQMDLDIIPHQSGCNCGYHALARALLKIDPAHCGNRDDLEQRLTSFAIKKGYSLIGEAFDPYTLAYMGNLFCEEEHISAKCVLRPFGLEDRLSYILETAKGSQSVILVPYLPNLGRDPTEALGPTDDPEGTGAHWGALDISTAPSPALYEGNRRGSLFLDQNWWSPTYKQTIHWPPMGVTPAALFNSNQAIPLEFDWDNFLAGAQTWAPDSSGDPQRVTRLDAVNAYRERVVVGPATPNSGPFADEADYRTQILSVMTNINALHLLPPAAPPAAGPLKQPVSLPGVVVEVKAK